MAVLQMQKIHICALNTDRKQILESLQRKGIVQINADQDTDIFHCTDTSAGCAKYEKFSHMADQALKILDTYAPEKKGLLASLEGKREVGLTITASWRKTAAQPSKRPTASESSAGRSPSKRPI